jgi:hypothetical protein
VFGHIEVATGSLDVRSADLRDVVFDAATKRLSLRANYDDGWEYGPGIGPKGRQGRTVLTFSGTVGPRAVAGKLGSRDAYCAGCKPEVRRVSIARTKETAVPQDAAAGR